MGMYEPTEMMLRLAASDGQPVATDAPEQGDNPVPYDAGLQQQLLELGPETIKEYGQLVVRGCGDPARYNAAVWYALAQEPILNYELRGDCVVIWP